MILSFNPQFVPKIEAGTKIHTIRTDIHKRWKRGNTIHFATGVRTKNYKNFKTGVVHKVERIFMTYAFNDVIEITVNNKYLNRNQIEQLALNDGFDSYEDFFNWFYPIIDKNPTKCYSARLIYWQDYEDRKSVV